jgi:hypothetical protein
MTTESNVTIAPDNTGTGAHNVRTVTVYPTGTPVSVTHGEDQQVVSLAGSDGAIVELTNGALPVSSAELALLLKAVIHRLDLLNAAVDRKYSPPDQLYE